MALSDMAVRQAKATGKAYTLPDLDGLSLAVTAGGGRTWHFRYYWANKQKRMSLGTYPEVSLREARALRDEARKLLAQGINPRVHRKQKRTTVRLADENTFEAVYKKWLAHRELGLKKGRQTTLSILPRVFAKDVLPLLGKRSIYDIKRPDLLEVIARIERRKALSVAEKVRTWFNQMFRYGLVIVPGLEQNPASDLDVVALPLPPVNHNPFLHQHAVREALRYQGQLAVEHALGVVPALLGPEEVHPDALDHDTQEQRAAQHAEEPERQGDEARDQPLLADLLALRRDGRIAHVQAPSSPASSAAAICWKFASRSSGSAWSCRPGTPSLAHHSPAST